MTQHNKHACRHYHRNKRFFLFYLFPLKSVPLSLINEKSRNASDHATVVVHDHCAAHGLFRRTPHAYYSDLEFKL
jgi:hypothetical protein